MVASVPVSGSSLASVKSWHVSVLALIFILLSVLSLQPAFASKLNSKSKSVFTKTDNLALIESIRIKVREANLYTSASLNSTVIRVAGFGAWFEVIDTVQDFFLVKDPISGSFLFVRFNDARLESSPKLDAQNEEYIRNLKWNLNSSGWWYANDYVQGRRRRGSSSDSSWNGCSAYDFSNVSSNTNYKTKTNGFKAVSKASEFEGTSYVWGGNSKSGIDCSGLVQEVFKQQGLNLPRKAHQQASQGKLINKDQLKPGDVIFFRSPRKSGYISHTGIYIGNGEFIHAASSKKKVVKSKLSDKYYKANYAFSRRY